MAPHVTDPPEPAVCLALASAFASDSVQEELCPKLQSLAPGALHLSLHVVDRLHDVVLASGNLLRPGLLTSSLQPLGESMMSAAAIGTGPKLWQLDDKRALVPREIASVTAAAPCTAFITIPLQCQHQPAFGFMLVAFLSKELLTRKAVELCLSLCESVAEHCHHQLQQHCRLVARCLLLANHHGSEEGGGGGEGASSSGGGEEFEFEEDEDEEEEEGWDPDDLEGEDGRLSEGDEGGPGGAGLGGEGRGGGLRYRRRRDGAGSSGAGAGGFAAAPRAGGGGGRAVERGAPPAPALKMDPLSLNFALPSAERAFQLHYTTHMVKADLLAFLVHALLLVVGHLSPWSAPRLTPKQLCQGVAAVFPLPLLLFQRTRQWYCRHRETVLWLLRLYTLCYVHIRMTHYWGAAAAVPRVSLPGGFPKLTYVYTWLALSSVTWQLRFSHHLPVTVLAHAVNVALCWQSGCPTAAASGGGGGQSAALECGVMGLVMGTLYVAPTVLLVYYVERRARGLFAAFLPFWD